MLETSHCIQQYSNIKEIKKLNDNYIAISTSLDGGRIVSFDTCDTLATIYHERLNDKTLAISFSPDGEFMAFSNASHIYVIHIKSKAVLKTINADNDIIEKLTFDLESKYILASTQNGRVLQYKCDGSSLLGRLYSFKQSDHTQTNKATSFAFYEDTMACSSEKGTIFCINLHSRTNKIVFTNNTLKVTSLCFLDNNYIISGDEKGDLYLNYLKNNSLVKKQETLFTQITQILLMPNKKYIILSGDENYIAIYNARTLKLVHSKYIGFSDVPKQIIITDENTLIASLVNNSIEKIMLPNAKKLKSFLVNKDFDKAYLLIEQDPLLRDTREYEILEIAYAKIYTAALDALVKQNKTLALKLTNIFKEIDEKQEDLQLLFKAFENYTRFKILYNEKKYALAYAMSVKYPPLMQTIQYINMEKIWENIFAKAQTQMLQGKKENALAMFNKFATIPQKRPSIKLVLKYHSEFTQFNRALKYKNYKAIARIIKKNALFTLIPAYENIEKEMQKSIYNIQKNINKCELESALKQLSKLQNIDSIAGEVSLQKDECKALQELQDAYAINDFIQCYEIIDKHDSLNATQLGGLLHKHWLKIISKCEFYALKGNFKDIKESLGELVKLSTRKEKIGDLFRLAFHIKIKALIERENFPKAEGIIYSYIDIFGSDTEIIYIMKLYEVKANTKLAITQDCRLSRDKWFESSVIME